MATATAGLHRPAETPGSAAMAESAVRKMAAEPIFVFSSSPPSCERFGARSGVLGSRMASSGEERLSGKTKAVKTGSRAAPIPEGAVTGFRTAKAFVSEIGGLGLTAYSGNGDKEGQLVDSGRPMETRDEEKENCPTISKGDRAKSKGSAVQETTPLMEDIVRAEEEKENMESVLLEIKTKSSRKTERGEDLQEDFPEPKPKKRRKQSDGPKLKLDKKPAAKKEPTKGNQTNVKKDNVTKHGAATVEASEKASFKMPPNLRTTSESSKYFEPRVGKLASREQEETTFAGLEKRTDGAAEQAKDITALPLAQTAIPADPASRQAAAASSNSRRPAEVLEATLSEDQVGSVLVAPAEEKPATYPDASKGAKARAKKKRMGTDADTTASKKPKPSKTKSPVKKKLSTITAHAIARANVPECDLDLTLQCTPDGAPQNEDYPIFGIENVRKPHLLVSDAKKSTGKNGLQDGTGTRKKKKSSTAKSKQVAPVEPKLRSPESALRRMQRQDFLFGTSSQLVREQDPTYLRDLQVALKASETEGNAREVLDSDIPKVSASRASRTLPRASRQLWLAGAEGDGEDYMALQLREDLEKKLLQDEDAEELKPASPQAEQERSPLGLVPIDDTASLLEPTAKPDTILEEPEAAKADKALSSLGFEREADQTKAISTEEDSQEPKPKSKGSKLKLSSAPQSKPRLVFQNSLPGSSFSSHTAISEIISSHVASQAMQMSTKAASGKSVGPKQKVQKRPRQKSATLEKEGDEIAPPKRRPGRPRKDATSVPAAPTKRATKKQKETKVTTNHKASNDQEKNNEAFVSIDDIEDLGISQLPQQEDEAAPTTPKTAKNGRRNPDDDGFVPIDEIEDNDPPTPSPPRRHSPSVLAQLEFEDAPLVEDTIPENDTRKKRSAAAIAAAKARAEAKARAQAEAQEQLFVLITRAVKSESPSKDPKNPSWWEKILMYDPIVLEELTAWLNDGVLDAASVAKMASPDVDEEHDGNDQTVEGLDCLSNGKLEPSLVRKWCDRNSICSVSRDGSDWR